MYNLRKTEKQLYKRIFRKTRAVSPVVATLILIIVAIVGAIGVGLIVSRVSTSTSNQANVGGAANGSQASLTIGGSTTIYPVTALATAAFEAQYGSQIINSQGGSGGGMQGVIDGDLNIGAASSLSAVYSAVTYVTANSITGVNLQAFQIGGSGVTMIMSSTANGQPIVTGTNPLTNNFITDGVNKCYEVSQAAAIAMYTDGSFYLASGTGAVASSCAGNQLGSGGVFPTAAAATAYLGADTAQVVTGPYLSVSRSDNSGTADTFAGWLGKTSTYPLLQSEGALGNPGLLATVQTAEDNGAGSILTAQTTNVAGLIGYVDLGFAEGAVAGTACQTGWTAGTPCNVSIPEASTDQLAAGPPATTFDPLLACTAATAAANCYVAVGTSDSNLHNFILNALKAFSNANPYMNNGYTVSYPDANSPSTGLVKVFYYVTNGTPTPIEQDFISFMLNPNAQAYFNDNGYFAWVQYAAA